MYHPRLKGSHYEMGRKMGTIFKKNNVRFPITLDPFQTEFGKKSGMLLEQFFPEAYLEIKGITDIIDYDHWLFTAWMMCMGCCLDIRGNECVEIRGCTAFSFTYENLVYYARNNDLPPHLKKVSKSIYYRPENKYSFVLNTSSFINGEEGMNQYGLTAAMTFVLPKRDEIKPGINSVFLVRYVLENCKTVNEGIEALKKLPVASSCNILLTDRHGEMAVVECNPFKTNIRLPEKNKQGDNFIITVNHFTSPAMMQHDAGSQNLYRSGERYQTAYNALKHNDFYNGIELAKNILSGKHGFMCQYRKDLRFDTIWSSVFDLSNHKIYRAEGNPRRTRFIEDTRLTKEYVA